MLTQENPLRHPRVLIIEDDEEAANFLKGELEDLGCECRLLVHDHRHEFEDEFDRMYPVDQPVQPGSIFQGTILDVIFKVSGSTMETEGGRDLYKYLRTKDNPRVLDHLGIILVVSQHDDPRGAFQEIGVLSSPKLQFSVKSNSKILRGKLNDLVAAMQAST